MVGKLARAGLRAATRGLLLSAIGLAGCVGTASVQTDGVTQAIDPSARLSEAAMVGRSGQESGGAATSNNATYLTAYSSSAAPAGASGLCARYQWACSNHASARTLSDGEILAQAKRINGYVNRTIRSAADRSLYGKEEHWALPKTAGDCEDYALLKKKLLLDAGVPAKKLFIATALNRRMEHHVVLIVRTVNGDLVLDNLSNSIRSWKATRYTFLKRQNPNNKARWQAVLLGPNATRT